MANLCYISYFLLTGAGKQAGPATSPESCRGDREVGFAKAEWSQVVHSGGILLKLAISIKTCLLLFFEDLTVFVDRRPARQQGKV